VALPTGDAHLPADLVSHRPSPVDAASMRLYLEEAMGWIEDVPAAAADREPSERGDGGHPSGTPEGERPRVLVADDNADMRAYLGRLLAGRFAVEVVADGGAALAAMRRHPPDLVLADVMMPGLDGFALLARVRSDPALRELPVVLLSARAGEESRVEGLQAGADDYLVKPFGARELLARVSAHLEMAKVRREATAAVRESEAQLRRIFDAARVSIWQQDLSAVKGALDDLRRRGVTDLRLHFEHHPHQLQELIGAVRVVDVNDWTLRMFGAARKEELLASLHHVFAPETAAVFVEQLVAIAARAPAFTGEAPLRTLRGERLDTLVTIAFPPEDPELRRVPVTLMDISERKAMEEALHDADRRKDEFLATLAHELRNPLAPIRNAVEIMRLARGQGEVVERARAIIERQLEQMVRLVDDLLDLSRITRNKIELRREAVPAQVVIESAVETSRPLLDAARHELRVDLPAEPLWVDADLTRMAQVIANLLNNAAKFTPAGGRVELRLAGNEETVEISVRDNGVGIPAEVLPHVFEMFTQGDAALDRTQGGLGIGLTVVKRLVEMHGGTVAAHSAGRGSGSEMVVRLPRTAAPRALAQEALAAPAANGGKRLRVLVVDDNRDAAESLAAILDLLGHEVRTALDGTQALQAVAELRPQLVLLDIGMPGMDGYEVARVLRAEAGPSAPTLVALTGFGQEEDQRRARAAGFDRHLTKPADLDALRELLERTVSSSAPRPRPA
jgi:signal transduction histidine kinase